MKVIEITKDEVEDEEEARIADVLSELSAGDSLGLDRLETGGWTCHVAEVNGNGGDGLGTLIYIPSIRPTDLGF